MYCETIYIISDNQLLVNKVEILDSRILRRLTSMDKIKRLNLFFSNWAILVR